MRKTPLLLTFLLLLVFTLIACSQNDTTFVILDSENRTPIEGAIVFLTGGEHVFRSDIRGKVSLPATCPDSKLNK